VSGVIGRSSLRHPKPDTRSPDGQKSVFTRNGIRPFRPGPRDALTLKEGVRPSGSGTRLDGVSAFAYMDRVQSMRCAQGARERAGKIGLRLAGPERGVPMFATIRATLGHGGNLPI